MNFTLAILCSCVFISCAEPRNNPGKSDDVRAINNTHINRSLDASTPETIIKSYWEATQESEYSSISDEAAISWYTSRTQQIFQARVAYKIDVLKNWRAKYGQNKIIRVNMEGGARAIVETIMEDFSYDEYPRVSAEYNAQFTLIRGDDNRWFIEDIRTKCPTCKGNGLVGSYKGKCDGCDGYGQASLIGRPHFRFTDRINN